MNTTPSWYWLENDSVEKVMQILHSIFRIDKKLLWKWRKYNDKTQIEKDSVKFIL